MNHVVRWISNHLGSTPGPDNVRDLSSLLRHMTDSPVLAWNFRMYDSAYVHLIVPNWALSSSTSLLGDPYDASSDHHFVFDPLHMLLQYALPQEYLVLECIL